MLLLNSHLGKYGGVFKSRQLHQLRSHKVMIYKGFVTTAPLQTTQFMTRNDTLMTRGVIFTPDFKSALKTITDKHLALFCVILNRATAQ